MDIFGCVDAFMVVEYILAWSADPPHSERREENSYDCMYQSHKVSSIFSSLVRQLTDVYLVPAEEDTMADHVEQGKVQ